jgi:hypothetical protein
MKTEFNPIIEFTGHGSDLFVYFDINSDSDVQRAPVMRRIQNIDSVDAISFVVDEAEADQHVVADAGWQVQAFSVKIRLNGDSFIDLATCTLVIPAPGRGGKVVFYSQKAVLRRLRAAIASASANAIRDYLAWFQAQPILVDDKNTVADLVGDCEVSGTRKLTSLRLPAVNLKRRSSSQGKWQGTRFWIAVVMAPFVVYFLAAAIFGRPKDAAAGDPVAAVSKLDPALGEQVRVQQQMQENILKEMGLDPGKAQDVGCLVGK